MNKQKLLYPLIAVGILVLLVIAMAGGFQQKLAPQKLASKELAVQTIVVEYQDFTDVVWLPANVIARQNTQVASRILANVISIKVRAGDRVKAGDVIAELDNQDLKAQVGQIRAQVEAVSAQRVQAAQQLKRSNTLREQGLISVSEMDKAQANFDQLNATKLSYEQQLDQAEVALTYSQIKAPISGKVVDRMVEPGDLVNPGQAIVALYNPKSIQISSYIPESKAIKLKLGQGLAVQLTSLQLTKRGRISEIVPLADSAARSFEVKLDLLDKQIELLGLMPGMYARVGIAQAAKQVIAINPKYIQSYGQLNKVKVLQEGRIATRFIRLGKKLSEQAVIVRSGLEVGDTLVI